MVQDVYKQLHFNPMHIPHFINPRDEHKYMAVFYDIEGLLKQHWWNILVVRYTRDGHGVNFKASAASATQGDPRWNATR